MNKRFYLLFIAVIFGFLILFLFFSSFRSYSFGIDAVYKIEEQRREHINFLFGESAIYHNKLFYFINKAIDIYLQHLSPSTIFSINIFPFSIIIFLAFYYGIFLILRSKSKYKNALLYWLLLAPLLLTSISQKPSFLSLYLLQAPILGFLIIYILIKVKK